jgi:RNA polymerase sigma-70 factor (ECF subfamily)
MIAELPPPLREVLVLCDLDERTDDDVAALLGVPAGTVKSRLRRARFMLRDMASARGILPTGESR